MNNPSSNVQRRQGDDLPHREPSREGALVWYGAAVLAGGLVAIRALSRANRGAPSQRRGWVPRVLRGRDTEAAAARGIEVGKSVTINRSIVDIYSMWRDFGQLPRAMKHLESVTVLPDGRSRWEAKGPAGRKVEWLAVVDSDVRNERITWRSIAGDISAVGSVFFKRAPGGRGTEVRVKLRYAPPAGKLGEGIAKLFGESPEDTIKEDLRRFKMLMETGEIATIEGQPKGE